MSVDWVTLAITVVFNAGVTYAAVRFAARELIDHRKRLRKLELDAARHYPRDWASTS